MAVYDNSPGVVLSREQVAQIAFQAGASGDDLIFLTGVPQRESSYRPGVHRTDSSRANMTGDFGLWQINYTHFPALKQAGIISQPQDLFDPAINARAAVFLLKRDGRSPWGAASGGWTAGGDPEYGWDRAAAAAAVQRATASGLVSQDWQSGGTAAGSAEGGPLGPSALPKDARLVQNTDSGRVWAFFSAGPGGWIRYQVTDRSMVGSRNIERLSTAQATAKYGKSVNGGDASELKSIPTGYGTFREYWNTIVNTVIGPNNPARNDAQVQRVLLQYAARPDMERAELENLLEGTKWFQSRTEAELQWNDLSEAERGKQRQDIIGQMQQLYRRYMGKAPDNAFMQKHADLERIASGKITLNDWVESVLKPVAEGVTESPWARELRDEKEAQRQRGFDIENTTARIRDATERYGIRWTGKTLGVWARAIVEKRKSDDDLTQALEAQAQALYPGLGPLNGADVVTLATPWLETYERVLEKKGSLYTPEIGQALAKGEPVWDMEKRLTKTAAWRNTRNADERLHSLAGTIDEKFGF